MPLSLIIVFLGLLLRSNIKLDYLCKENQAKKIRALYALLGILISKDSLLIINNLSREYRFEHPTLGPYHVMAINLIKMFFDLIFYFFNKRKQ
jgi:hypothetical protein